MGRKEKIIQDMVRLGTYEDAYLPSIDDLVTRERERSAIRKAWKSTAPPGMRPSFEHPLYAEIKIANRDIDKLRNELGLVPAGLQRLRKNAAPASSEAAPTTGTPNQGFAALMNSIQEAAHGKK